jgi:hypothetical protein
MATEALSTACDDGNQCTADVKDSLGRCSSAPLSRDSKCTSTCHVTGTVTNCNGAGQCVDLDDPTTCLGYCPWNAGAIDIYDSDEYITPWCNFSMFPLLPYATNKSGTASTDLVDTPLNNGIYYACLAQRCTMYFLQLEFYASDHSSDVPENYYTNMWTFMPCSALIAAAPNDAGFDPKCLKSDELDLKGDALGRLELNWNDYLDWFNVSYYSRVCSFYYDCAVMNTTAFADPGWVDTTSVAAERKRRSVIEDAMAHSSGSDGMRVTGGNVRPENFLAIVNSKRYAKQVIHRMIQQGRVPHPETQPHGRSGVLHAS